jgi:hypothetical protein
MLALFRVRLVIRIVSAPQEQFARLGRDLNLPAACDVFILLAGLNYERMKVGGMVDECT